VEKELERNKKAASAQDISLLRDQEEGLKSQVELDPDMRDFYTTYDPNKVTVTDQKEYENFSKGLSEQEKKWLQSGKYFYEVLIRNEGGLVMPLIFEFAFADGSKEIKRIPAEIWKMSEATVSKVFAFDKEVIKITLDPFLETADVETQNNVWPISLAPSKFELFKQQQSNWKQDNPMQRAQKEKENEKK
jgi:hypothetical protein